jgi:hypothetical protein
MNNEVFFQFPLAEICQDQILVDLANVLDSYV